MFNFIQQLFQKQKTANVPFTQELIERSQQEKAAYKYWKTGKHKDYLVALLRAGLGKEADSDLDILQLNTPKVHGFILKYASIKSEANLKEFQYLFDYFKEQILKLNYVSYVSDVKNFVRPKHVEIIERHYLKPRFSYDEEMGLSNQLYGNVLIEHLLYNEKSIHIKFVCNVYNDRKWTTPLDFELLIQKILC